jgi:Cu2+-exporting ATPase
MYARASDQFHEYSARSQVVEAVVLGRATLAKIRQNLAWALVYNLVGIPLAAGALLPVTGLALNASAAGGLMAVSSLAVVSNSLLLRYMDLHAGMPDQAAAARDAGGAQRLGGQARGAALPS